MTWLRNAWAWLSAALIVTLAVLWRRATQRANRAEARRTRDITAAEAAQATRDATTQAQDELRGATATRDDALARAQAQADAENQALATTPSLAQELNRRWEANPPPERRP